jgi:hypothetical protein
VPPVSGGVFLAQDSGQLWLVKRQEVLFSTMPHWAILGPSAERIAGGLADREHAP